MSVIFSAYNCDDMLSWKGCKPGTHSKTEERKGGDRKYKPKKLPLIIHLDIVSDNQLLEKLPIPGVLWHAIIVSPYRKLWSQGRGRWMAEAEYQSNQKSLDLVCGLFPNAFSLTEEYIFNRCTRTQ